MRKLLDFMIMISGVILPSMVGLAMEIGNEFSRAEEGPPFKKCKVENSDYNPLLFSVINLTPDAVDYYLSFYWRLRKGVGGLFYDEYEKSIEPKSLLHQVYLNDHPELHLSSSQLPSQLKDCWVFPNFKRQGCNTNEYSLDVCSDQFSWGRVYILCPMDIPKKMDL